MLIPGLCPLRLLVIFTTVSGAYRRNRRFFTGLCPCANVHKLSPTLAHYGLRRGQLWL